ncbi:MAG: T9SS type A sorting domain-containing protein [Bacteriovoracaceae bacterium]
MNLRLLLGVCLCCTVSLYSQLPDVGITLHVKDDLSVVPKLLGFGLGETATDNIDSIYGETELPPMPPTGIFDARFVGTNISLPGLGNGVLVDFRHGGVIFTGMKIHQVQWQNNTGAAKVSLVFNLPPGVTLKCEDFFGGAVVNSTISGKDSVIITNLAITTVKLTVTYQPVLTPPAVPVLASPANGTIVYASQVLLTWLSVADAAEYFVQAATDSIFTNLIKDGFEGTHSCTVGPLANNATYYWRVRSKNANGMSAFSTPWKFTAVLQSGSAIDLSVVIYDNLQSIRKELTFGLDPTASDSIDPALGEAELPPAPPTGVFDARFVGTNITMPQFGNGLLADYRQGSSAFTGTKTHQIQWQNNTSASQMVLLFDLPAGIAVMLEDFFGGTEIKKTISGKDSLVITNLAITTVKMSVNYNGGGVPPPATPVLVMPLDGDTINTEIVSLMWEAVNGADMYRVQLAKDSLFVQMAIDTLESTIKISSGVLDNNAAYYWRVRAENVGGVSSYSPYRKFIVHIRQIDWANLQWPGSITITAMDSVEVYGQVWIDGVTALPGPTPGLEAWVVFTNDTSNLNPDMWSGMIPAFYNAFTSSGNNDEYVAKFAMPPGTYFYLYKYMYYQSVAYGGWENSFYDSTKKNVGRMTVTLPETLTIKKYVAVGDGFTMGWQSGSLYESAQIYSFPNLLAQQLQQHGNPLGVYEQPVYSDPGTPDPVTGKSSRLEILNIDPLVVGTRGLTPGVPKNSTLLRPYDNLGIAGMPLAGLMDTSVMHIVPLAPLVLRSASGFPANVYQHALALSPDLITFWLGFNDVAPYAISGGFSPIQPTTGTVFASLYQQAIDSLLIQLPDVRIIAFTIPGGLSSPYFTHLNKVLSQLPWVLNGTKIYYQRHGNAGPSFDTLSSIPQPMFLLSGVPFTQDIGKPSGAFYRQLGFVPPGIDTTKPFALHPQNPWPDVFTLDSLEQHITSSAIESYNQAILAVSQARQLPVVDMHATAQQLSNEGIIANGKLFTSQYITGEFFSLDGIHPSSRGYAIIANEIIKTLNARYQFAIPFVDVGTIPGIPGVVSVERKSPSIVPATYQLEQNYPNPFNPATTIVFSLPKRDDVRLSVFDVLGREMTTLVNKQLPAGTYSVRFDGSGLSSGIYLYRLQTVTTMETRKMQILK